jgi:hypothetical protein
VTSSELSNNYLDLRCESHQCYDKFNNKVYLTYDECKKKCSAKFIRQNNIKLKSNIFGLDKEEEEKKKFNIVDVLIILLIVCIIQRCSLKFREIII